MRDLYRILILINIPEEIDILKNIFSSYHPYFVSNEKELISKTLEKRFDLFILDDTSPDFDAVNVCARLKTDRRTNETPVIFISERNNLERIEKLFASGGSDYIPKPFIPWEIRSRIKNQLEIRSMISHLETLNLYNQITGIFNRRRFFELGNRIFNDSRIDLYTMIIYVEGYQSVNKEFGSAAGDKLINAVTHVLKLFLGDKAVIGRLGSDVFASLFHLSLKNEVDRILEKIDHEINNMDWSSIVENGPKISLDIAYIKVTNEHKTLDSLLTDTEKELKKSCPDLRFKSIFRS